MRLNFDITDEENRNLVALQKQLGLSTKKALFENAISLVRWAVGQHKKGRAIASIEDDGVDFSPGTIRELAMPMLDNVPREGGN